MRQAMVACSVLLALLLNKTQPTSTYRPIQQRQLVIVSGRLTDIG